MAQMLGVWMNINNPNRSTSQDLNLMVGGTIMLSDADLKKLGGKGGLFAINIKVMDEDTFSDDTVFTDSSFQVNITDTNPKCFHTGVIVPHGKLNDCEWLFDHTAEIYCRVMAKNGAVQTNAENTKTHDVDIA